MKTLYCIALEGNGPTGVDWYDTRADRDAAATHTGAEEEIYFTLEVADGLNDDEMTELADDAAWEKDYVAEGSWKNPAFAEVAP
jgi:hypothetical protein